MKLAFYIADMFLDVMCLSSFLFEGEYEFAGSQFVIILVSLALQFRKSTPCQLLEAVKESWLVGLPSNLLRNGSFRKTLTLLLSYTAIGVSSSCFVWAQLKCFVPQTLYVS